MGTLELQSNRPLGLYSNTVIGTLAVGPFMGGLLHLAARRGLGGLWPRPFFSLLYQAYHPTHQRAVYQLHIGYSMWHYNYLYNLKGEPEINNKDIQRTHDTYNIDTTVSISQAA